jgi:hypothetical protein
LPTSIAGTTYRDSPLIPSIPSLVPKALSGSLDTVSSKALGVLDAHQAIGGFKMSTPNTGSPESAPSYRDSSSCPSSETNITDIDLLDVVTCTPFVRRLVLDDIAQLLEHVLVALENIDDNSRGPSSFVLGVLDDILTKSDHTLFVKIITSVTENWAKCNRLITKPALDVTQERLREVERNSLKHIRD